MIALRALVVPVLVILTGVATAAAVPWAWAADPARGAASPGGTCDSEGLFPWPADCASDALGMGGMKHRGDTGGGSASSGGSTYVVRQCGWGDYAGANWGWRYNGRASFFTGETACPGEGLAMWSQGGLTFEPADYGEWSIVAPQDVTITKWTVTGKQWHNGLLSGMFACIGQDDDCDTLWLEYDSCGGYEEKRVNVDGEFDRLRIRYGATSFHFVPACDGRIRGLNFEIRATDDSSISPEDMWLGGDLLSGEPEWKRGDQSLYVEANDSGGGVRQIGYSVDGGATEQWYGPGCHVGPSGFYDDLQACPRQQWRYFSVNTANYADGCHEVEGVAQDATGATVRSGEIDLLGVFCSDNTAPEAPEAIVVEGGDGWHDANGFNATVVLPMQGSNEAPITAVWWRAGGGDWARLAVANGAGTAKITGIQVPGTGEHDLQVAVEDKAGNHVSLSCSACAEMGHGALRLR